jgi:hypothetical protein
LILAKLALYGGLLISLLIVAVVIRSAGRRD